MTSAMASKRVSPNPEVANGSPTPGKNPPVRHPVVQTHPETGKKVLFVNSLFTTHIEGLPPLESAEVLQFLWRHASCPSLPVASAGSNSMVLWDNRSTQHKPVNDFFPATRRLHRVVSEGDQPY